MNTITKKKISIIKSKMHIKIKIRNLKKKKINLNITKKCN